MAESMTEKKMAEILTAKGWGVVPPAQYLTDMEDDFLELWASVSSYTMTSIERGYALYKAVEYICRSGIPGDLVECGVWKGGSCMIMARALRNAGDTERRIYLYDTYEGMTEPGGNDYIAWNGSSVLERWKTDQAGLSSNFTGWAVSLDAVRNNILKTGISEKQLEFIKGPVEYTLSDVRPEKISLLRLDTDWYESTKKELEELYPLLSEGGALIIDDYGHFTGARKAVDDYFAGNSRILLNRIDYTGRIVLKN